MTIYAIGSWQSNIDIVPGNITSDKHRLREIGGYRPRANDRFGGIRCYGRPPNNRFGGICASFGVDERYLGQALALLR